MLDRHLSFDFRAGLSAAAFFLLRDFFEAEGVLDLRPGFVVFRASAFGFLKARGVLLLWSRGAVFLAGVPAFNFRGGRTTVVVLPRGLLEVGIVLTCSSGSDDFRARDSGLSGFWGERSTRAVLLFGLVEVSISLISSASCFTVPVRAVSFDFRGGLSAAAFSLRDFFEAEGVLVLRCGIAVLRASVFGFLKAGGVLLLWSLGAVFLVGVPAFSFRTGRSAGALLRWIFFEIESVLILLPGRAGFAVGDLSVDFLWLERGGFVVLPAGFFENRIFFAVRPMLFDLVGACMTRLANGRFGDSLIGGNGLCTTCTAIPAVLSTTGAKRGMLTGGDIIETFCSTAACSHCMTSCREL
jgi:hypothetical protein